MSITQNDFFRKLQSSLLFTLQEDELSPKKESESEKLKKCQILIVQFLDSTKKELFENLWVRIQTLAKNKNEYSILISALLVSCIIDKEKTQMNLIVDFVTSLFQFKKYIMKKEHIDFIAGLFDSLLTRFGDGIMEIVTTQNTILMKRLFAQTVGFPLERYADYSFLNQIVKQKQYLIWKELKNLDLNYLFENVMKEETQNKNLALTFLGEMMKFISKLEKEEQRHYFSSMAMNLLTQAKEQKSNYFFMKFNFIYKYIFGFLSKSFFSKEQISHVFEMTIENVRQGFSKNDPIVNSCACQMLMEMVTYNQLLLVEKKHLSVLLGILYDQIQGELTKKAILYQNIFSLLTLIFTRYSSEDVAEYSRKIGESIVELMLKTWHEVSTTKIDMLDVSETFMCFRLCLKNLGTVEFFGIQKMKRFVENSLIYNFDNQTLSVLEILHKLSSKAVAEMIETRLKHTISIILKREIEAFEEENDDVWGCQSQRLSEKNDSIFATEPQQHKISIQKLDTSQSMRNSTNLKDDQRMSFQTENDTALGRKRGPVSKLGLQLSFPNNNKNEFPTFCFPMGQQKREIDTFIMLLRERYQKDTLRTSNERIPLEKKISIALEALAQFNFNSKSSNKQKNFIKDVVFVYLQSQSIELRRRAAKIVFILISDQTSLTKVNDNLSNDSVQKIIEKIMSIAIGDPDDQVRKDVLIALNEKMCSYIVQFLLNDDSLRQLIILVNDLNPDIQKQSILLLQKLIPSYPELLARFDQIIFVATSFLNNNSENYSLKSRNYVKVLSVIAKNSQFLIKSRLPVIIPVLINNLGHSLNQLRLQISENSISEFLTCILKCLSYLIDYQPDLARQNFEKSFSILVHNFQNLNESTLAVAIKYCCILTRNSGFQMIAFIKYDIIHVLQEILENNSHLKLRMNTLKFLGTIGAVDTAIYKQVKNSADKNTNNGTKKTSSFITVLEKIRKNSLNFERYLVSNNTQKRNSLIVLYEEFINEVYHIQRKPTPVLRRYLEQSSPEKEEKPVENIERQVKKQIRPEREAENEQFVNFNEKIQNEEYLLGYIIHHTVKILIETINSSSDEVMILECLESLQQIILILGKFIFRFKCVVFFPLVKIFKVKTSKNIRVFAIENIKYFTKASGKQIMSDTRCVSKLIKIMLYNFENKDIQSDLFVICKLLVKNKTTLPYRFKDILLVLLQMLNKEPTPEFINSTFEIILLLNNSDYYYLITPALIELFPKKNDLMRKTKETDLQFVVFVLKYLTKILKTKHFETHLGNVVRALTSLINQFPEINNNIKRFLIDLIRFFEDRCSNFMPLLGPYLRDSNEFIQMTKEFNEKGYIETRQSPEMDLESTSSEDETYDENRSLRSHSLREGNHDLIKDLFIINNFNKSDFNWNDWFTRLKNDLISNSYSTVLIACKNLRFYKVIMDKLFKPAFVMMWSQLNEHQKKRIIGGLNTIISNTTKIQVSIRKRILELVEFMSHRNEFGIVLNITKLAEFAINCHNPSKAIFFKEMEFQTNPENATEALLNLYIEVGYRHAAEGLLEYAQNTLGLVLRETWKQLLGKWYLTTENTGTENKESSITQVFSSIASSNWESALHKIKDVLSTQNNEQIEPILSNYRAKAAFHLGRWDVLKKCISDINSEKEFYKSILSSYEGNQIEAIRQINEELKSIERNFQNVTNYSSNYEKFIKLQKFVELENTFRFKRHFETLEKNELYNYLVTREEHAEEKNGLEKHILEVWEDKLFLMERNIDYWQEILATRNFFSVKNKMLLSYLKLSNLCYLNDNPQLFTRILTILKKEIPATQEPDALLELAEIECNYKTSKMQQKQALSRIEELCSKRKMPKPQIPLFYKKMGPWILKSELSNDFKDERIVKFFERFLGEIKDDSRLWHYFGIANYQIIKDIDRQKVDASSKYIINALQGFTYSISHESKFNSKYTIQDLLRFLELWYEYHDYKHEKISETIEKSVAQIPNKNWVLIVRQILARLEQKSSFSNAVKNLLSSLVKEFPQYLVFPLLLAKKSENETKVRMVNRILRQLEEGHRLLVQEATDFSEQLIRISILLEEVWSQSFAEAYRYKIDNNIQKVLEILNKLFDITSSIKGASSIDEIAFFQRFGGDTKRAREFIDLFESTKIELFFNQAWDIYCNIISELDSDMKNETDLLQLETTSPELFKMKNLLLCVPGTLKRDTSKQYDIRIIQMNPVLKILKSKRRPRKLTIYGSNAKAYSFLLKGNEDLRLDERVMQLLNMINDLLKTNTNVTNQVMKITTFNVLPLSYNCGIISWLDGRDTVFDMLKEYRNKTGIPVDCERDIAREFNENYNLLSKIKKLEVFRYVADSTKGEDLKNIFWLRSPSADVWLTNRNNYICSLAVMSIVGYILGLGDRHLMNIMIERSTGKIVHIDYGDCFESASMRDRLPEKVPFRLTRMLVKAMEACGIEGTFKSVCETVMNILRVNKDVILAVLEEFICDPLLAWKLAEKKVKLEGEDIENRINSSIHHDESKLIETSYLTFEKLSVQTDFFLRREITMNHDEKFDKSRNYALRNSHFQDEYLNEIGNLAFKNIIKKLSGKEFDNSESDHKIQVRKLIRQAMNPENISQNYSGWNPFL